MAVTSKPIYLQSIQTYITTIVNANGTTAVSLAAAGTNGSKIEEINCVSNDNSSAYTLNFYLYSSSTLYQLGCIDLYIQSGGIDNVPSINLLATSQMQFPKDSNGNPYIYLANGNSLYISVGSAVNSGKTLTFFAHGGNF